MQSSRRPILGLIVGLCACSTPPPVADHSPLQHSYAVGDPRFTHVMGHLLGPPIVDGNSIQTLVDLNEAYDQMLRAIRSAERSVTMETYIYEPGRIGRQFAEALIERARAGVKVHVIIDGVGGGAIRPQYTRPMEEAGVEVLIYNPLERMALLFAAGEVNHRTHRKLLVIDGRIAFIGGLGIADEWHEDGADATGPWRDNHYRVEGPVVAWMQAAFMDNWLEWVGQVLDGEDYLPTLAPTGDTPAQVLATSPQHDGVARMELMYLLAINAAEQSIHISTAYFVPTNLLVEAFAAARHRGVSVRLVIPGHKIDEPIVREASKNHWDELLAMGVEIYEYQPAMYHCKVMVVDGRCSIIGSANLDPRSFRLNDEVNLNVYDPQFAARQIELIEQDIARSVRVRTREHQDRPLMVRCCEFLANLLKPNL